MPTLTAVMSFSPGTATGVGLLTRVPLPSSAPGVVAPALNRVVDAQGAGAGPAGAQRDGAREAHDRGRDRAAGLRPVPEFAEPIVPPTAGGAVREQRAARLPGSVYARRAGQTMHRDGGESAGVRSIAQLPTPVAAPALNRRIGEQRARVVGGGTDRRRLRQGPGGRGGHQTDQQHEEGRGDGPPAARPATTR